MKMHDSRPQAHFYSCDKQVCKNGKFKYIKNRNGDLFAGGTKRSSYKDFELQDHYIYGVYRGMHGYLSARGIKDMIIVEPFEDDYLLESIELLISYKDKIEVDENCGDVFGFKGYDFFFSGTEIIYFLKAAKKYSKYNIDDLIKQISKRKHRILKNYEELYDKDLLRFDESEYL